MTEPSHHVAMNKKVNVLLRIASGLSRHGIRPAVYETGLQVCIVQILCVCVLKVIWFSDMTLNSRPLQSDGCYFPI